VIGRKSSHAFDFGRQFPTSEQGAIAQLGERVNGIHEVGGSIPPGSTNISKALKNF
jgi:hypothetical protein